MKKILALILSLLMAFSLTACGGNQTGGQQANTSKPNTSQDTSQTNKSGETNAYTPTSALTLVVCASAGGDSDVNARFFAEKMSEISGVAVVVSNVSGGSGSVGEQTVLDAGTDGNTALFYHNSLTASAAAGSCSDYVSSLFDVVSCCIQDGTSGWFVPADSPYESLQDVIDAAAKAPDTITFATEVGASTYAAMLQFEDLTGADLHPVDVGTSAEKQAALLSGTVDISAFQWSVAKDYVEAGQFRCLGVVADERALACPDVPTFKEQGIDVVIPRYFVMAFNKGTDQAVKDYWAGVMAQICADEKFQNDFFATTGAEVVPDPIGGIDLWIAQENLFRGMEKMMRG